MPRNLTTARTQNNKTRPFIYELGINFALAYSITVALFVIPYLVFIRKIIPLYILGLYLGCFIIYSVFWLYDKKGFIKNEFNN
jgi:hypothetical protein